MNHEQRLTIKKNLDILLRRKKTIIVFLLLAIAGGTAYYLQLPKIYQCAALIRYQQQSVNPSVMSPDDTRSHTRDIVNTIRQQITSRTSLESIINEHDLYSSMRENVPMENIVDMMKEFHIATRLLEGGDVFEVSYLGSDQQKVMDVTNALAQRFIEENLRFRQAQASQTSTYIRDELKMAKQALDEKEKIMRDYKLRYYNEMPDQLLNNTSRLNGLQEQYQNLQSSRLQLEQTRLLVQEQIAARIEIISQRLISAAAQATTPRETEGLTSSAEVRQRLQTLQTRYTDNHPEIRRLKRLLETLESQKSDPARAEQETLDPQIMELKQQLKDIEFNINRLRDERLNVEEQIRLYESWIAAAPIREAEWSALTRDYEQLNEHYQRLVTQSLQAESSQSLEKQLQGSQFKIVDKAYFPEKPLRPNYQKIMLLAIVLGLGLGGAVSFGFELLGTSFKDPDDLEKYLGIPVVSALPSIPTRQEILKKRMLNISVTLLLFLCAMAILAAIYYFWDQGMIVL